MTERKNPGVEQVLVVWLAERDKLGEDKRKAKERIQLKIETIPTGAKLIITNEQVRADVTSGWGCWHQPRRGMSALSDITKWRVFSDPVSKKKKNSPSKIRSSRMLTWKVWDTLCWSRILPNRKIMQYIGVCFSPSRSRLWHCSCHVAPIPLSLFFACASSVGVPDRPLRRHRHGRPSVGRTFPAAPRLRGLWDCGDTGSQTHEGQLERRRLPHQRQHQADEGGGGTAVSPRWTQTPPTRDHMCQHVQHYYRKTFTNSSISWCYTVIFLHWIWKGASILLLALLHQAHWASHWQAGEETRRAHRRVRPARRRGQQAPPAGPLWDVQHPRVLSRGGQPRLQHPHPSPGGPGEEGLLRGSPARRQLWPVRRDQGHRCHLRAGRGN